MSIQFFKSKFQKLSEIKLAEWKKIPPAIAGDVMNRQNVMAGRISPISFGTSMAGQARTVSVISGDNAALHEIITHLRKDEVLVVDAGNYPDRAVWGGILNTRAMKKKIAGVVIDGAARDAADMREMGVPVFVSALSPAGPHKGWGGSIDDRISCGGVSVMPGDIILGDDDGVTVVPLSRADITLKAAKKQLSYESEILEKIANDEDVTRKLQNIEVIEMS